MGLAYLYTYIDPDFNHPNGKYAAFGGMSKNFYFDPWMWWGILSVAELFNEFLLKLLMLLLRRVYVVGGFWLLEIFTSLGQFVISCL